MNPKIASPCIPPPRALGRHLLVEFTGCDPSRLDEVPAIENAMTHAAQAAGATVIETSFHHFSPIGVSGVVVIQESHLAIHTWPEHGYAAVDLFTCGDKVDPWIALESSRSHSTLRTTSQSKSTEAPQRSLDLL